MGRHGKLFSACVIMALACGFASSFVMRAAPVALGMPMVVAYWAAKPLAMVLLAAVAFREGLGLRAAYGLLVMCELASVALGLLAPVGAAWLAVLAQRVTAGASIAVTGSALYFLPRERMRSGIVLGFALSMVVVPPLRLALGPHVGLASAVLSLLYLAFLVPVVAKEGRCPVFLEPCRDSGQAGGGPPGPDGARRRRPLWLAAPDGLTMAVVVISTLLAFILGMLESHYAFAGQSLASTDAALLAIAAVVFALFLASLASKCQSRR